MVNLAFNLRYDAANSFQTLKEKIYYCKEMYLSSGGSLEMVGLK